MVMGDIDVERRSLVMSKAPTDLKNAAVAIGLNKKFGGES
jgi:hypothetical protein